MEIVEIKGENMRKGFFRIWYCDMCGNVLLPVRGERLYRVEVDGLLGKLDLDQACMDALGRAKGDPYNLPRGPLHTPRAMWNA